MFGVPRITCGTHLIRPGRLDHRHRVLRLLEESRLDMRRRARLPCANDPAISTAIFQPSPRDLRAISRLEVRGPVVDKVRLEDGVVTSTHEETRGRSRYDAPVATYPLVVLRVPLGVDAGDGEDREEARREDRFGQPVGGSV